MEKKGRGLFFWGVVIGFTLLIFFHLGKAAILINNANVTIVFPANHTFVNGTTAFNVTFGSSKTGFQPDIRNITFILFNSSSMIILAINTSANQSFYQTSNNTASFSDGVYNLTLQTFNNSNLTLGSTEGNFTPALHNITIDNNPPRQLTLHNPAVEQNFSSTSIPFNWTAFDTISLGMRCDVRIDNVINTSNLYAANGSATNQTITVFEGRHLWNVTCRDMVNNTNTSGTQAFTIATTLPNLTLHNPINDNLTNASKVTFNFTALSLAYTVLDSCNLTLNPTNATGGQVINSSTFVSNGTASTYINTLPDGVHTWNVRCTDSAGNTGFSSNISLTVDTRGPQPLLITTKDKHGNTQDSFSFGDAVTLVCSRSDSVSGINITRIAVRGPNVGLFTTLLTSFSTTNTTGGEVDFVETDELGDYVSQCEVTDVAGNVNRTNSTFTVATKIEAGTSGSGFKVPGFLAPIGKIKVVEGITSDIGVLPDDGTSRLLQKGATVIVHVGGENHKITVIDLTSDFVTLEIRSELQRITVEKEKSSFVDLDDDDIADLEINFHKRYPIVGGKWADLTFKPSSAPVKPESVPDTTSGTPTAAGDQQGTTTYGSSGPLMVTIVVIVIILVVGYLLIRGKKK